MQINLRRYGLYLLRWQASTPLLAAVEIVLFMTGPLVAAVAANFIGGLIFFWVDQDIFTSQSAGCRLAGEGCGNLYGLRESRQGLPACPDEQL